MGSREWIKINCDGWIEGTLRQESPEVRGVWADLLALAGSGRYGDIGEIKLPNGIGLTDRQICEILAIKRSLWRKAKQRLLETDRIKITEKRAIVIVNWRKYQSEYHRQKPYRHARKATTIEPDKYIETKYGHIVKR